jgi:hypothetical protein
MQTMEHFGKIPSDSSLPAAAQVRRLLVNLYEFRMVWLAGSVPEGALHLYISERYIVPSGHLSPALLTQESSAGCLVALHAGAASFCLLLDVQVPLQVCKFRVVDYALGSTIMFLLNSSMNTVNHVTT